MSTLIKPGNCSLGKGYKGYDLRLLPGNLVILGSKHLHGTIEPVEDAFKLFEN